MTATDYFNIARCAADRHDQLWDDAIATYDFRQASLLLDRRWREHESYRAIQALGFSLWSF